MSDDLQKFHTIRWAGDGIEVLDQRKLPESEEYLLLKSVEDVFYAIKDMVVRGAPLIGVTAAYGVALAARSTPAEKDVEKAISYLSTSRPTAVNLFWALERMKQALKKAVERGTNIFETLLNEAHRIKEEDVLANKAMGDFGAELLPDRVNVLTHCNAGALATAGWGTALGVIRSAVKKGKNVFVYADETRPVLQGARLTAWELAKDGIPVKVIPDNAAAYLMKKGLVDCVIVGADRIASNGDVANKIGTFKLAICANYFNIPFYVAAPESTFDFKINSGEEIPIEERDEKEVKMCGDRKIVPENVEVWNPAFDVTPAELVTAIITEKGVIRPPFKESIRRMRQQKR